MNSILKQKILDHKGGIYVYRLHKPKLESLNISSSDQLTSYLHGVFDDCPDEYFNNGHLRCSQLKFKLNLNVKDATDHEVNMLSTNGLLVNADRYKNNHSKVQVFMLEHDKKTIAAEVPIWASKEELPMFNELFSNSSMITGHIDVLRVEDGKIWVWDYKPNAHREEYATTQVFFYALMLAKRTGIDLSNFMCGYFDSNIAYTFSPMKHASLLQASC